MECITLLLGFLFLFSVCFARSVPTVVTTGNTSSVSTGATPTVPSAGNSSTVYKQATATAVVNAIGGTPYPPSSEPPVSTGGTPYIAPSSEPPALSTVYKEAKTVYIVYNALNASSLDKKGGTPYIAPSSEPPVSIGGTPYIAPSSEPPVSIGGTPYIAPSSEPPVSIGGTPYIAPSSEPPVSIGGTPPYIAPSSEPPVSKGGTPFLPRNPRPKKGSNLAAIIAGCIAGALFITSVVIFTLVKLRKRKRQTETQEVYSGQIPGMPTRFSYEELRVATDDFKEKLGAGGFGTVFKGVLGDGTNVAVKRLDRTTPATREFLAEVESIGSIHHFNLTRLIGFCAEKSDRLLVYEYMSNGSLDNWIFNRGNTKFLNWQTRKKIVLDIARGLAYLHEECRQRIIHLDIKPQNILLDEHFNAKVSDFGLSKLIDRDESQVETTMRGTPGYLAPEWRMLRITVKVDVYSFGIVLLEIVCGRRNFDSTLSESCSLLLRMLQEKAKEDKLHEIVEHLHEDMENHKEEVVRMINIGAWCLQDDHAKRPSMSTVVKVLEGVMEVELNISYTFTHANGIPSAAVANDHVSTNPPEASVLSYPR